MGRTKLRDGLICVSEDSQKTMLAPKWGRVLSIVHGSLNPVPVCDLDHEVLTDLMAENCGLTLVDARKRSEYSLVTSVLGSAMT